MTVRAELALRRGAARRAGRASRAGAVDGALARTGLDDVRRPPHRRAVARHAAARRPGRGAGGRSARPAPRRAHGRAWIPTQSADMRRLIRVAGRATMPSSCRATRWPTWRRSATASSSCAAAACSPRATPPSSPSGCVPSRCVDVDAARGRRRSRRCSQRSPACGASSALPAAAGRARCRVEAERGADLRAALRGASRPSRVAALCAHAGRGVARGRVPRARRGRRERAG